ncbi:MAG: cation:proton antiporter [Chloroflexota bacterium]
MTGSLGLTLLAALLAALVLGALALRLRLPPIIGYIIAGLAVGPFTPGFVADREQVLQLADIGVALLMFSIGLQFKIRELLSVGRLVLIGVPVQVAITMLFGLGIGLLVGWSPLEAAFVGAAVAICSTVVLAKVVGESVLRSTTQGQIAVGWSIMQDLLTVVLVVVLSELAAETTDVLRGVVLPTVIALLFVGGVVTIGSRVLPPVLSRVARLGSRELFVVAISCIAIGTAFGASALGVSIALGAFVAGLALSESDLASSVLGEIVPLRELFSTIFFVSAGILVQPLEVIDGWAVVLLLLVVIVVVKGSVVAAMAWLGGYRPAIAVRAGGMVAQAGEFSFVLATAGLGVGAVSPDAFSEVMGAVILSMIAAGPVLRVSERLADALDRRLPDRRPMPPLAMPDAPLRRHAVILGYGRTGSTVARVLEARGFAWIAIDGDYTVARVAREAGRAVMFGSIGAPSMLDSANIGEAHTLLVCVPDAIATRQAVAYARRRNPRLGVVARAQSERDADELRHMGVERVIVAERQLSNELVRHALRRFGISDREISAIVERRP